MTGIGDKVLILKTHDSIWAEELGDVTAGDKVGVMVDDDSSFVLPPSSLGIGDLCTLVKLSDKTFVHSGITSIKIIKGIVYPACTTGFVSNVFSANTNEISIRGAAFCGGIEV